MMNTAHTELTQRSVPRMDLASSFWPSSLAPWTMVCLMSAFAIQWHGGWAAWLQYSVDGPWWTMLTGHLTHWTGGQLCWDAMALACLGGLCERRAGRNYPILLLVSAVGISLGLRLWQPDLTHYRGLSGVATAVFCHLGILVCRDGLSRRQPRTVCIAAVSLLLLMGKLSWECAGGGMLFVQPELHFQPLPLSHLLGAVLGGALAVLLPARQ